jgi:hypothetical protein
VLHAVRVRGFGEAAALAGPFGMDEDEVANELKGLAEDGLVTHREKPLPGWTCTQDGKAEHGRLVGEDLEASGAGAAVDAAYRSFLGLNPELLAVCTAWQLRPEEGGPVPNDHSNADYDAEVVERLATVDAGVQPIADELAGRLQRYAGYSPRLSAALTRVRAGEHEWVTRPLIDSYHTVWMELHEDLMATLGIRRGEDS